MADIESTPSAAAPAAPVVAALAAIALAVGALTGCSTTALLNALQPRAGVRVTRDRRYAPGARGTLDVYAPRAAKGNVPVVLFIYGGSWDSGRKAEYEFVGDALASAGMVAVIPDYRVYPQVRWPAFLQDNARALRWAVDHAAAYGGDPHDVFLMGHSAGAYDALMLGLDPRWLAEVGLDPVRDLQGVIGLAGPYDFLPLTSARLQAIFGPPQGRPATQPINFVTGHNPPLFLATDQADKEVDPGNTMRLAARVRAAGGDVSAHSYAHLTHALLLGVFAVPLRAVAPVRRDVVQFIRAHAAPHALAVQP
ncbi:MAG TPA: alpha/beta hydrolase [Steroidobacteraceae bacterium]|jgi:acetyl esterase/lipase|nr:alpha/beta hydrolase [Steroidobacteraceae bacterium]